MPSHPSFQAHIKNYEPLPILIIGAGPVGLILAYSLAHFSRDSPVASPIILIDHSATPTQYSKMDLTNPRSMEILRRVGLSSILRNHPDAVPPSERFDSAFVTGLGPGAKVLGEWKVDSPLDQEQKSLSTNDGSFPVEAGLRCSQIVVERVLRDVVLKQPGLEFRANWRYISHIEEPELNRVRVTLRYSEEQQKVVYARFLVGYEGGSSAVRRQAGIDMASPLALVHFRPAYLDAYLDTTSKRYWHTFPASGGFLIDQDGKETFTAHYPLPPPSASAEQPNPYDTITKVLTGIHSEHLVTVPPSEIQILVHSTWTPSFALVAKYSSDSNLVHLAGDAAHRTPPHGGYGLNSGISDAADLAWRLSSIIQGYGGSHLLEAHTIERRNIMRKALMRSSRHLGEHIKLTSLYQRYWEGLSGDDDIGGKVRSIIRILIDESGSDIEDWGVALDSRLTFSPCIYPVPDSDDGYDDAWDVKKYKPTTRPGHRAPHVFLQDAKTSIYDLFGKHWTLVHFSNKIPTHAPLKQNEEDNTLLHAAAHLEFPVKHVTLHNEPHERKVYERDFVLIRPDTHVAWRGDTLPSLLEAEEILAVVSGNKVRPGYHEFKKSWDEREEAEEKKFLEMIQSVAIPGDGDAKGGNDQGAITGESFA
ncbi:FAD binding domain-containing protein [Aspergillus crustosus]